jgi:SAM-dependent methyltransferase
MHSRGQSHMSSREDFAMALARLFAGRLSVHGNFAVRSDSSNHVRQQHTNEAFSDKWGKYEASPDKERLYEYQREWYLKLYGFGTEESLATFLKDKQVIMDAGSGLGFKAAWLARLAPHALVVGMDFSDAAAQAARTYAEVSNLFFIQGDIADTGLPDGCVDYTSCDQVIQHTENPERTFAELARVTSSCGEFACYFYAKKALPRELLDEHFRTESMRLSRHDLWVMSSQLTELGKRLSELQATIDAPDIPALGIKGGRYDIQRFIYWNFLKCFWNPHLGVETSTLTNFDWYSPSNARRFSEQEVQAIVNANAMDVTFFHAEDACYSGRFTHRRDGRP